MRFMSDSPTEPRSTCCPSRQAPGVRRRAPARPRRSRAQSSTSSTLPRREPRFMCELGVNFGDVRAPRDVQPALRANQIRWVGPLPSGRDRARTISTLKPVRLSRRVKPASGLADQIASTPRGASPRQQVRRPFIK